MSVLVAISDMGKVEEIAGQVLSIREPDIVNGRLDGRPWFLALIEDSSSILDRMRAWNLRAAIGD